MKDCFQNSAHQLQHGANITRLMDYGLLSPKQVAANFSETNSHLAQKQAPPFMDPLDQHQLVMRSVIWLSPKQWVRTLKISTLFNRVTLMMELTLKLTPMQTLLKLEFL